MSRHNKGKRRRRPKSTSPQVPPRPPRGVERIDARPKAPWHPFPLVELAVLAGLVLLVMGALDIGSDRGKILLVTGMALGSLGGLETALREHLTGFRSHTTILASLPAVLVAGVLFFARVPWIAVVLGAVITFALAFTVWRRTFRS
jgi:hypothetical protein